LIASEFPLRDEFVFWLASNFSDSCHWKGRAEDFPFRGIIAELAEEHAVFQCFAGHP
jgi:hypothetical protein